MKIECWGADRGDVLVSDCTKSVSGLLEEVDDAESE